MSVLEDIIGPHVNRQSFHVFGIFLSLQSNLVPPKTNLKTKRRNLYPSWSRTRPSEDSLARSMYLCKASSQEVKRSMFSVNLVACMQSLRWQLREHLTRYINILITHAVYTASTLLKRSDHYQLMLYLETIHFSPTALWYEGMKRELYLCPNSNTCHPPASYSFKRLLKQNRVIKIQLPLRNASVIIFYLVQFSGVVRKWLGKQ